MKFPNFILLLIEQGKSMSIIVNRLRLAVTERRHWPTCGRWSTRATVGRSDQYSYRIYAFKLKHVFMKKLPIIAIAILAFVAIAVVVVLKSEQTKVSIKAGGFEGQLEGTSAKKPPVDNLQVPAKQASTAGSNDSEKSGGAVSHGSQSPAISVNSGSTPINITYGDPKSNGQ